MSSPRRVTKRREKRLTQPPAPDAADKGSPADQGFADFLLKRASYQLDDSARRHADDVNRYKTQLRAATQQVSKLEEEVQRLRLQLEMSQSEKITGWPTKNSQSAQAAVPAPTNHIDSLADALPPLYGGASSFTDAETRAVRMDPPRLEKIRSEEHNEKQHSGPNRAARHTIGAGIKTLVKRRSGGKIDNAAAVGSPRRRMLRQGTAPKRVGWRSAEKTGRKSGTAAVSAVADLAVSVVSTTASVSGTPRDSSGDILREASLQSLSSPDGGPHAKKTHLSADDFEQKTADKDEAAPLQSLQPRPPAEVLSPQSAAHHHRRVVSLPSPDASSSHSAKQQHTPSKVSSIRDDGSEVLGCMVDMCRLLSSKSKDMGSFVAVTDFLVDVCPSLLGVEVVSVFVKDPYQDMFLVTTSLPTSVSASEVPSSLGDDLERMKRESSAVELLDSSADVDASLYRRIVSAQRGVLLQYSSGLDFGVAGRVFATGTHVSCVDVSKDPYFDARVDLPPGCKCLSMTAVPLYSSFESSSGPFGVLVVSKGPSDDLPRQYQVQFMRTLLCSSFSYEREMLSRAHGQGVLKVLNHSVTSLQQDVDDYVTDMVRDTMGLVQAERIALFVVDAEREELVCHTAELLSGGPNTVRTRVRRLSAVGYLSDKRRKHTVDVKKTTLSVDGETVSARIAVRSGFRVPMRGIAGEVARTGQVLNVKNAKEHALFDGSVDEADAHSMLVVPLKDARGRVIAVLRAVNKRISRGSALLRDVMTVPGSPGIHRVHVAFSPDDRELLTTLGVQLGSVIDTSQRLQAERRVQERSTALVDVMKSMTTEVDFSDVARAIVEVTARLIKADRVSLYQVDRISHELVCEVSTHHDVGLRRPIGDVPPEQARSGTKFFGQAPPPNTGGVAGRVARTGSLVNMSREQLLESDFFSSNLDDHFTMHGAIKEQQVGAMLVVAVFDADGQCAGVLECVRNLRSEVDGHGQRASVLPESALSFSEEDCDILQVLSNQASIALHRASMFATVEENERRNQALVEVVKIASGDGDVETIIGRIVAHSYKILPVERVTLFIVDNIRGELWCKISKDASGFRLPLNSGVVGHVATTKQPMNIPDAYQCEYFNPAFDRKTNFHTQSILCLPVLDKNGRCVAVTQAINKKGADNTVEAFSAADAELLSAVNHEIANVLKRKSLEAIFSRVMDLPENTTKTFVSQYMRRNPFQEDDEELEAQNQAEQETATADEAKAVEQTSQKAVSLRALKKGSSRGLLPSQVELADTPLYCHFDSFPSLSSCLRWDFDPFQESDEMLLGLAFQMFEAFDLLDLFHISRKTLQAFLAEIASNYRDNPYHNFRHGWAVLHCAFMVISGAGTDPKCTYSSKYLTIADVFCTLTAAFCHDVDHPGFNNSFKCACEDELAILYNDRAVLENHHAALTFQIMYEPSGKFNIMESFKADDRRKMRTTMIKAILATDIADHQELTSHLQNSASELTVAKVEDRTEMVRALVHSADLSNSTLPFTVAKKWADRVVIEFYEQSLREKEAGLPVTPFMAKKDDVSKANLNINFINYIVEPLWSILATDCFPYLRENIENLAKNKKHWQEFIDKGKSKEADTTK